MARAVAERHMEDELKDFLAALVGALGVVDHGAGVGFVAPRGGTLMAFVYFGVCVSEGNSVVPYFLGSEPCGVDARNGLDEGGFAVGDVADGADIEGGLPADGLGGPGVEVGDVLVVLGLELTLIIEGLDLFFGEQNGVVHH